MEVCSYICILKHLCALVLLTSSSVSNLCVCAAGGGSVVVAGPMGDGGGPLLPQPGCTGRAGIPLGLAELPLCSPPADNPHVYLMLTCCLF